MTAAQELRSIISALASRDNATIAEALEKQARRLDAAAALIITADPDQAEQVALALGDPGFGVESKDAAALAADFALCDCADKPQDQRETGHHPDCPFWDEQAAADLPDCTTSAPIPDAVHDHHSEIAAALFGD